MSVEAGGDYGFVLSWIYRMQAKTISMEQETCIGCALKPNDCFVCPYISKLPMKNERIWSYVKETTSHLQNKLT